MTSCSTRTICKCVLPIQLIILIILIKFDFLKYSIISKRFYSQNQDLQKNSSKMIKKFFKKDK